MVDHQGGPIRGLQPQWKKDPNLTIIESIARKNLNGSLRVQFFAQGGFNKLYRVDSDTGPSLMQVALPVDPHYKTLSEVATIEFVRKEAQIPVPKIIAFDTSSDNDLGYEYIIMEMVPGQPLRKVWRKMLMETKEDIVKQLARHQAALFRRRFDGIGNVYDSSMQEVAPIRHIKVRSELRGPPQSPGMSTLESTIWGLPYALFSLGTTVTNGLMRHLTLWSCRLFQRLQQIGATFKSSGHPVGPLSDGGAEDESSHTRQLQQDPPSRPTFTLGRIVSLVFFWDDHLSYDVPRGPFRNSHEWLRARLSLALHDQKLKLEASKDKDDIEDAEGIIQDIHKLIKILPSLFPPEELESSFLFHDDLSLQNILVDEAGKITAIIDWECVSALPVWRACQLPQLLEGKTRDEEPKRKSYGDVEEPDPEDNEALDSEGKTQLYWGHLLEYEVGVLQKVFLAEMQQLEPQWIKAFQESKAKYEFEIAIQNIDGLCGSMVDRWLTAYGTEDAWSLKTKLWG